MRADLDDDRGRRLHLARPPRRIVSLVPSDTFTLLALGAGDRLVGRTDYCVEPEAEVAAIPALGGTKNPRIEEVIALEPDVILMNQEENTLRDAVRLEERGLKVFVTFPKRVAAGVAHAARLLRLLGDVTDAAKLRVKQAYDTHRRVRARSGAAPRVRAFVPIWFDPWMTIHRDTYISDVLDTLGADNVFGDRRRRFPLVVDLGGREVDEVDAEGRDTRYPRVAAEEIAARRPDVVLFPDEPFAFGEAQAEALRALEFPTQHSPVMKFVSGRDLMWPGLRGVEGLERLEALLAPLRRTENKS